MVKQIISSAMALAVTLCLLINSAEAQKFSKDDEWLIYMYICGTDLEENWHMVTSDITEMQQVKLPKNVKVLINVNGSRLWHHPTLKEGGNGIYLYSGNSLRKLEDRNENMGDPHTLANFLSYGEKNFNPDHRILIFGDHGGLNGLCYDKAFKQGYRYNLSYDNLTQVFSFVYPNFAENRPFELIGFDACLSASYELANSIANFSHYMIGSEPSEYGWYYTDWLSALAKDPSINGAQIGKIICDSAMKSYEKPLQNIQTFSVIDLTKMPQLHEANEEFFGKANELSDESNGFSGAFARAAYAKNTDNYSNWYTDLWSLAKNIQDLMPQESKNLQKAIDKAVVYKNRGAFLNARGISTAYPYLSSDNDNISQDYLERFLTQDSMPVAQKNLYRNLMNLEVSNLQGIELNWDKNGHVVAELEPEQLENVLMVRCMMFPVIENGNSELGLSNEGTVLLISDDLKTDWKKGTITENIRPVQPVFDGHRIMMELSYQGRGYNFYEIPIILRKSGNNSCYSAPKLCYLQVRYDIHKKEYFVMGINNEVENGMVIRSGGTLEYGDIITPVFLAFLPESSNDSQNSNLFTYSYIERYKVEDENDIDPETQKPKIKIRERVATAFLPNIGRAIKFTDNAFIKLTTGESFVYNQNSKITEKKISNGDYIGYFQFFAPNGSGSNSMPFVFAVEHGEMVRSPITKEDMEDLNAAE